MNNKIMTKCDRLMHLSLIVGFLKKFEIQKKIAKNILLLETLNMSKAQIRNTRKKTAKIFTNFYGIDVVLTDLTIVNFCIGICDKLIDGSTGIQKIESFEKIKESILTLNIDSEDVDYSKRLLENI